jgi:hypothetical protein
MIARLASMTINDVVFDTNGNPYTAGYGPNLFDPYSKKGVWIKKFDSSGTEIIFD